MDTRASRTRRRSPHARAEGTWAERAGAVALVGAAALGLVAGQRAAPVVVGFVLSSQCAIALVARARTGLVAGVAAAARRRLPRRSLAGWIGRQWEALLPSAALAAGQGLLVGSATGLAGPGAWVSLAVFVAYLSLSVATVEALIARIGKTVWAGTAPPSAGAIRRVVLAHAAFCAAAVLPLLVGCAAAGGDPGGAGGGAGELAGLSGGGLVGGGLGAALALAFLAVASALAGAARSLGDAGRASAAFLAAGIAAAAGLPVTAVAGVLAALMVVLLLVLASNVPRVGVHVL